jgi:hypothetical protein
MTRAQIIAELKQYFSLPDLVCPDAYRNYGVQAWQFLSTAYLHTLLIVRRDILRSQMICNNYLTGGGRFSQRGLRCNLCETVRSKTLAGRTYISAHVTGNAGDFDVVGMSSAQARSMIIKNINLLPFPVRLEQGVTWLHLDSYDSGNNEPYTLFNP